MAPRRVLAFTLQVLPWLLVLLLLYPLMLPPYETVVLVLANACLEHLTPPTTVETDAAGDRIAYLLANAGQDQWLFGIPKRSRLLLYSNLVLLPALVLATPMAWRRRLVRLGWALVLLVLFHVLAEIGWVHTYRCMQVDPHNDLCRAISVNLEIGGPLFAVVQWALLCWGFWVAPRMEVARPRSA